jgi:hypothetical protein
MFDDWDITQVPTCPDCGLKFRDMFEAVEHFLEDDEDFDPMLILPGGYRLMVGSLLKSLYDNRDNANFISEIVQSTYATLFMAEVQPELISDSIEDIIVESEMVDFDVQLKNLFKNGE